MGFLNALGVVSRRDRWRRALVFWDFQADAPHDVTDATLSLVVYRQGAEVDGCRGHGRAPVLALASDDGYALIRPAGRDRGALDVPQVLVARVPPGLYWASVEARYPDGSYLEVLREAVRFVGPDLPPPALRRFLTADAALTADREVAVNAVGPDLPFRRERYLLTADTAATADRALALNDLQQDLPFHQER